MKTIYIDFSKKNIGTIAKQGEHNEIKLIFALPGSFEGADYINAEFEKRADGSKCVIENLEAVNGALDVLLTQDITSCNGTLSIQLVAYQVSGDTIQVIAKTPIIRASVDKSIEATEPVDTQPSLLERLQAWLQDARDKLTALWELRHNHGNKATLDSLYYYDAEYPEVYDPDDPIQMPSIDPDTSGRYLRAGDKYLRKTEDGGVIARVITLTKSGKKYLRFTFNWDPDLWLDLEAGNSVAGRPMYVDIPIEEVNIQQGGNTLELDLGVNSINEEIIGIQEDVAANTAASHTHDNLNALNSVTAQTLTDVEANTEARHSHSNKSIIDQLSFVGNAGTAHLTFYDNFVNAYHIRNENDGFSGYLNPNVYTRIGYPGTVTSFTITSLYNGFQNAGAGLANEYIVAFRTGATAPTVTFPSSVIFQQELKLEPNKFYEISIVENIAIWCAVDVEVAS